MSLYNKKTKNQMFRLTVKCLALFATTINAVSVEGPSNTNLNNVLAETGIQMPPPPPMGLSEP